MTIKIPRTDALPAEMLVFARTLEDQIERVIDSKVNVVVMIHSRSTTSAQPMYAVVIHRHADANRSMVGTGDTLEKAAHQAIDQVVQAPDLAAILGISA